MVKWDMQISKITIILMIIICVCVDNSYMYLHVRIVSKTFRMSLYVDYLAKKNNEGIYLKSFFLVQDYNKNIPKY